MNYIVPLHRFLRCPSLLTAATLGLCSAAVAWGAGPAPVPTPVTQSVPVTVTNSPDIAKAEGIQHPFQRLLNCIENPTTNTNCESSFDLRADRRLVIEYVSSVCTIVGNGILLFAGVSTTVAGEEIPLHALNYVDHPASGAGPRHLSIAAHTVRIYADAGTTVRVLASRNAGDAWACSFALSGQTIDVP
jgi:hypothetical protein